MNTPVFRVLAIHNLPEGVVLELKSNQKYFSAKLRKREAIEIDAHEGGRFPTQVRSLVMMDEPHPDCDIGILLPKKISAGQIRRDADVWKIVK